MDETTKRIGGAGSVLVVDDVDIMRITCQRALERSGFRVTAAKSGLEALRLLDQEPFEVVVLDIRMPGISGLELLKIVRDRGRPVEVILMTAYADAQIAKEALNLGASALLHKPFEDIGVLVAAVSKSVARVRMQQGGTAEDRDGLEQALLQAGLLDAEKLRSARERAEQEGSSLRSALLSRQLLDEEEINWAVADYLDLSYVRLTEEMLDHDLIKNFPPPLARQYGCIPLFRSGQELHLVTANPFQPGAKKVIAEALELTPVFAMGSETEIARLIDRFYGPSHPQRLRELTEKLSGAGAAELPGIVAEIWSHLQVERVERARLAVAGTDVYEFEIVGTFRAKTA